MSYLLWLPLGNGYPLRADGIPIEGFVQRVDDGEHAVETRDAERLDDGVVGAHDDERSVEPPQPPVRPDEDAERGRIDEGRLGEIHDDMRPALVDRGGHALLELRGGEEVDLAGDGHDVRVAVDRTVFYCKSHGHRLG